MLGPIRNRTQTENGRTYLREMAFGDPDEPHHAEARAISAQTEDAIAVVLRRDASIGENAATLARIVSAISFLAMAAGASIDVSNEAVVGDIRTQLRVLLAR